MPAVFVHGNPETTAVWEPLPAELAGVRSDLICLSPPGFGVPLPAGFDATQGASRDWLVARVGRASGPGGSRPGRRPRRERGAEPPGPRTQLGQQRARDLRPRLPVARAGPP